MFSQKESVGNWKSIISSLKTKFGDFSHDELARVEGNVEQLVKLVQRKSGQSQEQIVSFISGCCAAVGTSYEQFANTASQYVDNAGDVVRENYDRMASEAKKGLDYTSKTVKRRPFESLAVAVGSGIIAGVVLGLSISNRKQ